MAKDGSRINGTVNLAIKIAAIILAIGAAWQTLRSHGTRIEKVEVKAHTTEIDTVGIKKDIERLNDSVDRIETEQKTSFEEIISKLDNLPKNEP